jgi:hypothetical protein
MNCSHAIHKPPCLLWTDLQDAGDLGTSEINGVVKVCGHTNGNTLFWGIYNHVSNCFMWSKERFMMYASSSLLRPFEPHAGA